MDHFKGSNAQERYQNDLLNELRKLNQNIERMNADKSIPITRKPRQKRTS